MNKLIPQIASSLLLALMGCVVLTSPLHAGDEYEKLLGGKSLADDAKAYHAQIVFRLTLMPLLSHHRGETYSKGYICSVTVPVVVKRDDEKREYTHQGFITLRSRKSDGKVIMKTRQLTGDELRKLVWTINDQEIFSLPRNKSDFTGVPGIESSDYGVMDASSLRLEKYDRYKRATTTIVRAATGGEKPFFVVSGLLAKLVKPWTDELEKEEGAPAAKK